MEGRYSRNPGVESAPMRGESVLFNPQSSKFCLLNATAAHLWSQLEKPKTVHELALSIETHFADVDSTTALRDIEAVLSQLLEADCVVKTKSE
jgi:hypothetical protein